MIDVDVLVNDHKKAVQTDEGLVFHTAPSLLSQLRDAIHGGGAADGAGAGGKAKLPFQAAALDLYNLIEAQVWEVHRAAFNRVLGAIHPETVLAEWAAWATEETIVEVGGRNVYAPHAVARWVEAIENYLNPPNLAEILFPCPACGHRYVYREIDGESVQSSALAWNRDRRTGESLDARCLHPECGMVWTPSQYMFFLTALNATGNVGAQ